MGRTGSFFAWQSFGVEPDALSMAKALGNGYPIGAMVAKRKYSQVLTPGTHASTFGGTALASAAACAVIDAIDNEKVLDNVVKQSKVLMDGIVELSKNIPAFRVSAARDSWSARFWTSLPAKFFRFCAARV